MARDSKAKPSQYLIAMASNLKAMASKLIAMASNLRAMASTLVAMASDLLSLSQMIHPSHTG